ncbi:MAG: glutamate racemase [Myxococcota bacterium]|nr:glutamate racemase [Myxococcota bacterium]
MSPDQQNLPIGVFDSGLGGLTVVRAIRELCPAERIVYLGDSARVPYGTRSAATVIRYSKNCAACLSSIGLKMLVVACNTASSVALPALRAQLNVPVLGVIEAGARAVAQCGARVVGVIGTAGTVGSGSYPAQLAQIAPSCEVVQQTAPLFVPLAEEGWTEGEVPLLVARRYLRPLVERQIEVLLLGCTHYPVLHHAIAGALQDLRSHAAIINSATAMAKDVQRTLCEQGLLRTGRGELRCLVTDQPSGFEEMSARFLGERPTDVELIDII